MSTVVADSRRLLKTTASCLFGLLVLMAPNVVYAGLDSDIGNAICGVSNFFQGDAGRGIATIGISILGIGALIGRVTWMQGLIVAVGVSVLFGAPYIVFQLGAWDVCPGW